MSDSFFRRPLVLILWRPCTVLFFCWLVRFRESHLLVHGDYEIAWALYKRLWVMPMLSILTAMFGPPSHFYQSDGRYQQPARQPTPYGGIGFGLGWGAGGKWPMNNPVSGEGPGGMAGALMGAKGPISAMGAFGGYGATGPGCTSSGAPGPGGGAFTDCLNGFVRPRSPR